MKYGFLGCGNMGGAVARALCKATNDVLLASKSVASAKALALELNCQWSESNQDVANSCDVLFLAVKPPMMADVLAPLVPTLQLRKPILVSMAAGLTLDRIASLAGGNIPVVRIMPNTPVSIGKGMITYCFNGLVSTERVHTILSDLKCAGQFDRIDENLMDAATVAAGCSPAYTYMFIQAIADGAVACGLPPEKALKYAAEAVSGAAALLLESGEKPSVLKDAVCSPGGSTIAGVNALENNGFQKAVMEAILAAYKRNIELRN